MSVTHENEELDCNKRKQVCTGYVEHLRNIGNAGCAVMHPVRELKEMCADDYMQEAAEMLVLRAHTFFTENILRKQLFEIKKCTCHVGVKSKTKMTK